jgi:hypothetical protein
MTLYDYHITETNHEEHSALITLYPQSHSLRALPWLPICPTNLPTLLPTLLPTFLPIPPANAILLLKLLSYKVVGALLVLSVLSVLLVLSVLRMFQRVYHP